MELLMEELFAGNSDRITRAYFDSLLLEMRHIDGRIPDTTFCLYGKTFDTPIMTAALSHRITYALTVWQSLPAAPLWPKL